MTILGHDPSYRRLSDALGARHFELTPKAWNGLGSRQQQWAENQYFLDRTLARGDRIVLATSPRHARRGSFFSMELRYLHAKGKWPGNASRYVAWVVG